ncbi:MAG: hypothetical protein ACR2LI_09845 [Propionibacteriaceae bacterium]
MNDTAPIAWTGIGSWPGSDLAEALRITFDECPELPYLPELPARGPHAQLIGRGTAFLSGLTLDLQPAGWRLTDASGQDHRLARSMLREDLDRLEEAAQGYSGPVKISATGPWTLCAEVERPRGDRVLGDRGARREVGQSLTQGLIDHLGELRRRLPDITWTLQLDEPVLPAVLAGSLTRAGFGQHAAVDLPEARDAYVQVVAALDAPVVVHCCAANPPVRMLVEAGVSALSVDLDVLTSRDWDLLAPAIESGLVLWAGVLPTAGLAERPPARVRTGDEVAARMLRPLRTLGFDPQVAARLVLTPACGLAGAVGADAVAALRSLRTAAGIVTDELPR